MIVQLPAASVQLPTRVVPSESSTIPVALPGATVTVKVTEPPQVEVVGSAATVVVVVAFTIVWVKADEVLAFRLASPE